MTSNVSKSQKFALFSWTASFGLIFIGCRIKLIRDKHNVHRLEPILQSYAEIYGTDKDKIKKIDE